MSNPVGIVAPPYTTTPPPLRTDAPVFAEPITKKPEHEAQVLPLGRPAIPLPVEAFLPYRDPEIPQTLPTAQEKISNAVALVAPTPPDSNAVDMLMPQDKAPPE